jgi:hypothetical protein
MLSISSFAGAVPCEPRDGLYFLGHRNEKSSGRDAARRHCYGSSESGAVSVSCVTLTEGTDMWPDAIVWPSCCEGRLR